MAITNNSPTSRKIKTESLEGVKKEKFVLKVRCFTAANEMLKAKNGNLSFLLLSTVNCSTFSPIKCFPNIFLVAFIRCGRSSLLLCWQREKQTKALTAN